MKDYQIGQLVRMRSVSLSTIEECGLIARTYGKRMLVHYPYMGESRWHRPGELVVLTPKFDPLTHPFTRLSWLITQFQAFEVEWDRFPPERVDIQCEEITSETIHEVESYLDRYIIGYTIHPGGMHVLHIVFFLRNWHDENHHRVSSNQNFQTGGGEA